MNRLDPGADPTRGTPRIAVGPPVVHDLQTLRAAQRAVILTDGADDLAALVPIADYRALLARLHTTRAAGGAQPPSALQQAVLAPAELDALLADDELDGRAPRSVGAEIHRVGSVSAVPGRRS